MKTIKLPLLFLSAMILFTSCNDPTGTTSQNIPDFIPEVVFGDITTRVIVDASDSDELLEAQYIGLAPILTSFKGNNQFKSGNRYSMPIIDSNMVFEIISLSGGSNFHFKGVMEDGSGWLNVYYNQSSKTFSFDQCIYADIPLATQKFIVYAAGDNISLDNNGYFHSLYYISYISYEESSAPNGWELASMTSEIFRGEMNPAGDVGTAISYYSDIDADYTTGTQEYVSSDGTGSDIPGSPPATVSIDNLVAWKNILSSNDVKQLDRANASGYWEILYKMDDGEVTRVSDDSEGLDATLSGYQTGFTADSTTTPIREDLSLWGSSSLLVDLLN